MKQLIRLLALAAVLAIPFPIQADEVADDQAAAEPNLPRVEITTSKGPIVVELFADKAPLSVKNFLDYVKKGFYDGTIFHRVIPGFMIQGGGFGPDLVLRTPAGELTNEADNGLSNERGTLAMARRNPPHSATSQFFINHGDNLGLDHKAKYDGSTWGYAVFGQVVAGMDVVDAIAEVPTGSGPKGMRNVPSEPVVIEAAVWVNAPAEEGPDENEG